QTYYGLGYVQLTWKDNYQKQDAKLDLGGSLVAKADPALEPDIAILVLFEGVRDGGFTGEKLSNYFNDTLTDWANARNIVNPGDKSTYQTIANYALKFCAAITHLADDTPGPTPEPMFPMTITVPEGSTMTVTIEPA